MSKCRHIYEHIGSDVCPDCGKNTHESDFKKIFDLHKQWIEDKKSN